MIPRLPSPGLTLRIVVEGRAVPAGSKTQLGGHGGRPRVIVDDSGKRGREWRAEVIRQAAFAVEDAGRPLAPPMFPVGTALHVSMLFEVRRAKKPAAGLERQPLKPPDVLKLARAVEDALTGAVWADDAQVVSEYLSKRYAPHGGPERVVVTITEVV